MPFPILGGVGVGLARKVFFSFIITCSTLPEWEAREAAERETEQARLAEEEGELRAIRERSAKVEAEARAEAAPKKKSPRRLIIYGDGYRPE